MNRCRIPDFCERYGIDIGIYDHKSKKTLLRKVKQRDICVHIHNNQYYCVIWKKNKRDSLLNDLHEKEGIFKNVPININENRLQQRLRYRFPEHETMDQLYNVFVFDLGTHNNQELAEAYAAGLYVANRLRDRSDRDLSPDEIVTEKDNVIVSDPSNGNPVMNMLIFGSENYEGDERTSIDKEGDEIVSS